MKPTAMILAAAVLIVGSVSQTLAGGGGFKFVAALSGDQEVTAPPGGVDTDTTGHIRLNFDGGLTKARYVLRVFDGLAITQAHLHCARAGENGSVVAFLFGPEPGGIDVDGLLERGTLTNDDIIPGCDPIINNIASLLAAVLEGRIYVNVHSEVNPAGEVRGQILTNSDGGSDGGGD
jgi:hypothetical protein